MQFRHHVVEIDSDVGQVNRPAGTKLIRITQEDADFGGIDLHTMEPVGVPVENVDRYRLHHVGEGELFDGTYTTQYLGWYKILGMYAYVYAEKLT
jgi:hypothetical protein